MHLIPPDSVRSIPLVSWLKRRLKKVITAPILRITAGESHMSDPSIALINGIEWAHKTG
jgi:hypothetical protein